MLKQRAITAIILAALVAAAIYWLPTQYFALTAFVFVVGLAGWEWAALTEKLGVFMRLLILLPTVIICCLLFVSHFSLLQHSLHYQYYDKQV